MHKDRDGHKYIVIDAICELKLDINMIYTAKSMNQYKKKLYKLSITNPKS